MDLVVHDAELSDAGQIVGILNPIIEARIYTAFTEPFSVEAERAYISNFPARGIWKVAAPWGSAAGWISDRRAVRVVHEGLRSRRDHWYLRGPCTAPAGHRDGALR